MTRNGDNTEDRAISLAQKQVDLGRAQVYTGVIGLLLAGVTFAQQFGLLNAIIPADVPIPQLINRTGAQIELAQVTPSNREGRLRHFAIVVTRAPESGRWKGRLCEGDQIQFIDGVEVETVADARRYIYGDRGEFATVQTAQIMPDGEPAPGGEVVAFGVERRCPALH